MTEVLQTSMADGLTARLYQDSHPESPREWSNVFTLVCWHRHYTLKRQRHQPYKLDPDSVPAHAS